MYLRVFQELDKDASGAICIVEHNELLQKLHDAGFQASLSDAQQLFEVGDKNGDGTFAFNEFCVLMEGYCE